MSLKNDEVVDEAHLDMYGHSLHPSTQDAPPALYPSCIFEAHALSQYIVTDDPHVCSIDDVVESYCDFTNDLDPGFTHSYLELWNEGGQLAAEYPSTQTQNFGECPMSSSVEAILPIEDIPAEHYERDGLLQSQQPQRQSSQEAVSYGNTLGAASNQTTSYQCLFPGCDAKPFRRAADLDRHWRHTHANSTVERFPCDYRRCERHLKPFTRRDHYRDHYRIYHNEDILRRGMGSMSSKPSVSRKWWRCGKCLVRVNIADDEWQCRLCNMFCEPERRRLRGDASSQ